MESTAEQTFEWRGTDRYEVRRCLGRGGMGVVYEAYDREQRRAVAVKTLRHFEPGALYLFKQEFRTLADVRHPNLVRFYELELRDIRDVFFTMELVHGVDLIRYAQRAGPALSRPDIVACDLARLRPAMRQLVEGLHALHGAGRLHRDIKPSNVLVTKEGRVVLLDFGVAIDLTSRTATAPASGSELVGTAAYMPPESGDGAALSPASDWYSVGVMMYEALVGRPPFVGAVTEILAQKMNVDAAAPSQVVPGVPGDIDALCLALLQRDPAARPGGPEILRRLGVARTSAAPPAVTTELRATAFIGRSAQIASLSGALGRVLTGETVAVRVSGLAGMGKSTLAQRFLDQVEAAGEAVVLRGRTYEREAVPYKAIDSVVDALSGLLVGYEEAGEPIEVPDDVWALAHLFPVLRRVPAVADAVAHPIVDPRAVRAQAFGALRDLLARVAARSRLVMFLDDVHWGDVDSASLLVEVLKAPGAPPLLLVMTVREDETERSPFWRALHEKWPQGVAAEDVSVGLLGPEDAEALAAALLEVQDGASREIARAVARESGGSPFLVEELARGNRVVAAAGAAPGVLSLESMVADRLGRLPEQARHVVETIAVGGRPLPLTAVAAACSMDSVEEVVALLGARRFVVTGLRGNVEMVEMSHDRIRETVAAQVDGVSLRDAHQRLARVLSETAGVDAEEVSLHWLAAGDRAQAARFAERAAEQAAGALAFDRAASLFRRTVGLLPPSSPDLQRCRARLAEALRYAGRFEESAQAYMVAAEGAPADQRIELRREAAQQLLSGGHIEKAGQVLREVLAAAGLRAPRSPLAALVWLIAYQIWLRVVGLRVRELPADQVPPARRLRIDALYTVVGGFSLVDPIVGACMQARHLAEALRGADANRLLRAVVLEAAHATSSGRPETPRERALEGIAGGLAERLGTPESKMYRGHVKGLGLFQRGRWREAQPLLEVGLEELPYGHPGLAIVRMYAILTDYYVGNLRRAIERSQKLLARAEDLGDLFTSVMLRTTTLSMERLVAGDPEGARASLREALADWPQTGFSVQHWQAMLYDGCIDLYLGRAGEARERWEQQWPVVKRSLLLHGAAVRIPGTYFRAQLALGSIEGAPGAAAARIAEARGYARELGKESEPWPQAMAVVAEACADNAAGDRASAIARLREGLDRLEATGTLVFVPPVRHRLGLLLGGEEGAAMVAAGRAAMTAQRIADPERWAALYLAGTWKA